MYNALVNNLHNFDLTTNEVNGKPVQFDCELLPDGSYHILLNNKSISAEVLSIDRNNKCVVLLVDNQKFTVQVKDDFDLLLSKMGMDKKGHDKLKEVKSPMPGLVLDIKVKVGDVVESGQALMVLEAMKMENVIAAPNEGVVAEIAVNIQEKVDKNQVLVRFEK
jgi:biotin carboxyl carrier protein